MALQLPDLFPDGIPVLLPQHSASVTLSRDQILSIIACGFFCIFDRINPIKVFNLKLCVVYILFLVSRNSFPRILI